MMIKKNNLLASYRRLILGLIIGFIVLLSGCSLKKESELVIDIGYQSVTSQTWGALIIKSQKMFEKKLAENFPDKKISIAWHNEVSGSAINNNMFANKYEIGFMGDMPLLINGYNSSKSENYKSVMVAIDGRGEGGKNQGIVVAKKANIKSVSDLSGKTISVPIGSSAHHMLLRILNFNGLLNNVTIVHHDVSIASNLIKENKIDAFAAWDPYPRLLSREDSIDLLADGTESGIDYLTGVVINKEWAENNEEFVVLFLMCLIEAHEYINKFPQEAAEIFSKETGFPLEITLEEAEEIKWDTMIYEKDISTFEKNMEFLNEQGIISMYSLDNFIDKRYLEKAMDALK